MTHKLVACPTCARRIAADARSCPKCGSVLSSGWAEAQQAADAKKQQKATAWAIVIVGGLAAMGWLSEALSTPESRRAAICSDAGATDAFVKSQTFVEKRLRAPTTASFPLITAAGVHANWTGGCNFQVSAFVDAQNGFGAQVRTAYDAQLVYLPETKEWQLKAVSIQ